MSFKLPKEPKKLKYVQVEFDFKLNPNSFLEWVSIEEGFDLTKNYINDCSGMCEYSCLYIGMLLYDKKLEGDMRIYCGEFGMWGHYWIVYKFRGVEYFIDLTLKQFVPDAPKLAITKAIKGTNYKFDLSDAVPIKEYLDKQRAFEFYTNPNTLETPKKALALKEFDFVVERQKEVEDLCKKFVGML